MNVRIGEMTSEVHVTDARALLTPEVMEQIVAAVLRELKSQQGLEQERRSDTKINRSAVQLD